MALTLYNHIRIEDDSKPIIPNNEFRVLIEKIKFGDVEYYNTIKEKYSLIPFQHGLIQQLLNNK